MIFYKELKDSNYPQYTPLNQFVIFFIVTYLLIFAFKYALIQLLCPIFSMSVQFQKVFPLYVVEICTISLCFYKVNSDLLHKLLFLYLYFQIVQQINVCFLDLFSLIPAFSEAIDSQRCLMHISCSVSVLIFVRGNYRLLVLHLGKVISMQ